MELHLSHDELLVFLTIIGVPTMNGLEDDPLEGLDERVIAERLNSGEQSLINRGLLVIDENSVTLDDTLVALVGSSVAPDATFLLTRIEPDGSNEVHYFNVTSEITVEHYSPKAGIYRFTYIPDDEALTARLHTLLEPLGSAPEPPAEKNLSSPPLRRRDDPVYAAVPGGSDCRSIANPGVGGMVAGGGPTFGGRSYLASHLGGRNRLASAQRRPFRPGSSYDFSR